MWANSPSLVKGFSSSNPAVASQRDALEMHAEQETTRRLSPNADRMIPRSRQRLPAIRQRLPAINGCQTDHARPIPRGNPHRTTNLILDTLDAQTGNINSSSQSTGRRAARPLSLVARIIPGFRTCPTHVEIRTVHILALETSIIPGSVALLDGADVLRSTELPRDLRTTQSLAPVIRAQLQAVGWEPSQLQLVAVSQGPGSFTGLRVGVTTAKTLAYATGAEILGVSTLDAIAAQAEPHPQTLWTVMDAHREQLFGRRYRWADSRWQAASDACVVDIGPWLAGLTSNECVSGPGVRRVLGQLPGGVLVEVEAHWAPRAGTIGRLAFADARAGRRDDVWKLVPRYGRASAAEEKADRTRDATDRKPTN